MSSIGLPRLCCSCSCGCGCSLSASLCTTRVVRQVKEADRIYFLNFMKPNDLKGSTAAVAVAFAKKDRFFAPRE